MTGKTDTGTVLREFEDADLQGLVELINAEYPDEPTTLPQEQHWESTYPQSNPRLRLAVEAGGGHLIGFGAATNPYWMTAEGVYDFYALVDEGWRRSGIGAKLLARLEPYARSQGATRLWTSARESQTHSIAWLERSGFRQYGLRFESALDLTEFDPALFAAVRARAEAEGYAFCTLAEQRTLHPDADRDLFELYRNGIADVPLPGGAIITPQWETWREELSGPTFDPSFVFLAVYDGAMVAMTRIELLANSPAITGTTCVLREHRGHGLATTIKVESLRALPERGYTEARTHNDTANPSIMHINEKLGYKRIPGWTMWEKLL